MLEGAPGLTATFSQLVENASASGLWSDDELASLAAAASGDPGELSRLLAEQALDSTTIDHRADIYSLGCTLHSVASTSPGLPHTG